MNRRIVLVVITLFLLGEGVFINEYYGIHPVLVGLIVAILIVAATVAIEKEKSE